MWKTVVFEISGDTNFACKFKMKCDISKFQEKCKSNFYEDDNSVIQDVIYIHFDRNIDIVLNTPKILNDIYCKLTIDGKVIECSDEDFRLNKLLYYNNTSSTFKYKYKQMNGVYHLSFHFKNIRIPEKGVYVEAFYKHLCKFLKCETKPEPDFKINKKIEFKCDACRDTGISYWSDGVYGECMECDGKK
jgi:hypothetical protein